MPRSSSSVAEVESAPSAKAGVVDPSLPSRASASPRDTPVRPAPTRQTSARQTPAQKGLAAELKKRDAFEIAEEEAFLNLSRTYCVFNGRAETFFRTFGISPPKYNVLRILRGAKTTGEAGPHGLPSLEVADRLVTRVPDITRLVDGLIADGFVTRTRCTHDRRVVYVGITPAGLELLARIDAPVAELHRQSFASLTARELAEWNRLMTKARGNVDG